MPELEQDPNSAASLAEGQNLTPASDETTPEAPAASELEGDKEPQSEQPGQKKHWVQRRIDELTQNWRDEQRRNQQLLDLLASKGVQPKEPAAADTSEPKPDAFTTYEDYVRAVSRWEAKQTWSQMRAEEDKKAQADYQQSEAQEIRSSWQVAEAKARATYDDYDEVVSNPEVPFTQAMAETILKSDVGTELSYYFGKHPEVAAQIAELAQYDPKGLLQAKEIGKIEALIAQEKPAAGTAARPRAPRPPTPVTKTSATDNGLRDDLPVDEWMRRRNAQIRGK